jgi:hypothetical protein
MKNKFKFFLLLASALTLCFTTYSCKKPQETDIVDAASVEDNSIAEKHYDAMFDEVDDAAAASGIGSRGKKYTISLDTMNSSKVMTLDYGDSNVLCDDGVCRRGKIIVSWTGRYRDNGTVIQITTSNFYQNDIKIDGTKKVTNMGRNGSSQMYWNIEVIGSITDTDGRTFTWSSNRVRTWVAGEATKLIRFDDKYTVTGNSQGKNRKGVNFTSIITKALYIELNCKYLLTAGTIEIANADQPSRKVIVDFGSGTCDNVGTYTVNGVTKKFVKR